MGWIGWAAPVPALALAVVVVMGMFQDHKRMNDSRLPERFGSSVGNKAPEFSLPDQEGNLVNLSDFKEKRNVLLIFVRGDWCPTCHIMLRSYEKNKERFAAKNIMLLAVGPDNVEVNKEMVLKLGLDYKLLSDTKHETVRAYGMQLHSNASMTKYAEGVPLPASFLVSTEGTILYTSNPRNAGEILNPETIIPVVDSLKVAVA
jgi:peroxiredoxin